MMMNPFRIILAKFFVISIIRAQTQYLRYFQTQVITNGFTGDTLQNGFSPCVIIEMTLHWGFKIIHYKYIWYIKENVNYIPSLRSIFVDE